MQVAVLGAGAMGALFGGLLAESGHDVSLLDIDRAQIGAIREKGLLVATDAGTRRVSVRIERPDEAHGEPDWLIVFTKTVHTTAALESCRRLIGPNTRLLSLQNGLGNAEKLAAFAARSHIAVGMTTVPADLVAPGQVKSHGQGTIRMTMLDGDDASLRELAAALEKAGLPCAVDVATPSAIWEKVAFNVALNSMCAVTYRTVGGLGVHREGRLLAHAIANEVLSVARAEKLPVSDDRTHAAIDHALDHHGAHEPSMLQDIRTGRPTEIETLNGAVVRAAERHGLAVPRTEALYVLVKMREETAPR